MYEIMNLTYSPIRLILEDNSEVLLGSRVDTETNTIVSDSLTDQIKNLSEKNFIRVKSISN